MRKIFQVDPCIRAKRNEIIDQPVIVRVSKIFNEDMAEKFVDDISHAHETGQTIIPIVIDSYGGSVYSLLEMISVIQTCKLPVATVVEGKAMSAGAILFCFGTEGYRYMSECATLMFHDVSNFTQGKVEEVKANAKETDRLQKMIFGLVAKHLGKKSDYFLDIIHHKGHAEWYVLAKEAKKHGICNHVGVPELRVKVSVEYLFG